MTVTKVMIWCACVCIYVGVHVCMHICLCGGYRSNLSVISWMALTLFYLILKQVFPLYLNLLIRLSWLVSAFSDYMGAVCHSSWNTRTYGHTQLFRMRSGD